MADLNITLPRIGLLLSSCILLMLTGCGGTYISHMDEMLNEYSCEDNSPDRVGPEREIILFVKHHIMVGKSAQDAESGKEVGFTRSSRHRIPWENNRIVTYRIQTIPALMEEVNELLWENDTNIFLVNDSLDVQVDDNFSPAEFDLMDRPLGHTRQVMQEMVAKEPGYIHILYGWTSVPTVVHAAGGGLAVIVADDPRYGGRVGSFELARAIVHSLGYQPGPEEPTSSTMMHYNSPDGDLSEEQVEKLWQAVNADGLMLKSISCQKP